MIKSTEQLKFHPYLKEGDWVHVVRGPLAGCIGILNRLDPKKRQVDPQRGYNQKIGERGTRSGGRRAGRVSNSQIILPDTAIRRCVRFSLSPRLSFFDANGFVPAPPWLR